MLSLTGHALKGSKRIVDLASKGLFSERYTRCLSAPSLPNMLRENKVLNTTEVIEKRWYSDQPRKKGFISGFAEEVKKNFTKDEQLQENIKKFRDEYQKIEQSEPLKKARAKFEMIEKEGKHTEQLKQTLSSWKETVGKGAEELGESEYVKKGKQIADDIGKTVGKTAETVYKQTESLSQTKVFQGVSQGVKAAKTELEDVTFSRSHIYHSPTTLVKRSDLAAIKTEEKVIEADAEATGMVMHKDSKWQQSWQNFKDNNQFVHKMFDMKTKYDESDNLAVRATRTVADKFTSLFGSVFSSSEMSAVVTEVIKMDPTFSQEQFVNDCRVLFIPNILEASLRGELDILKDWCYEAEFNKLAMPVKQAKEKQCKLHSCIIDVGQIDIMGGQISEQGPVLIISFATQQTVCLRSASGQIMEGDPDKVLQITNVWAFCRDQSILDNRTAWKLMESHANSRDLFM